MNDKDAKILYIDATLAVIVPLACPECGTSPLLADIEEWDTETGEITEIGFILSCPEYDWDQSDGTHRLWQSDWQSTITQAHRWLSQNVRVRLEDNHG